MCVCKKVMEGTHTSTAGMRENIWQACALLLGHYIFPRSSGMRIKINTDLAKQRAQRRQKVPPLPSRKMHAHHHHQTGGGYGGGEHHDDNHHHPTPPRDCSPPHISLSEWRAKFFSTKCNPKTPKPNKNAQNKNQNCLCVW